MQTGIWKLLDECVILQTKSFNVLQFRLELQNCIALQRSGFKVLLHVKSLYISPPVAAVNSCDCKVSSFVFDSQSWLVEDIPVAVNIKRLLDQAPSSACPPNDA